MPERDGPERANPAAALTRAGAALADERRFAEAIPYYEKALAIAPGSYALHLNLGIACKHTGEWARSLAASLRAFEIDAARANGAALWNAGVAATALGDWARARWAWTEFGIELPAGDGPIDMNIGLTPIRVSCDAHPEVVWCHRIDPARARIESVPAPESGRRYRDLLLHDGEPRGKRRYGGELVSVFDELAVVERSAFRTWSVDVTAPSEADVAELAEAVKARSDAAFEDWTASLHVLCKACSEGVPHEHEAPPEPPWRPERTLAIATADDRVLGAIDAWARAGRGRSAAKPELRLA